MGIDGIESHDLENFDSNYRDYEGNKKAVWNGRTVSLESNRFIVAPALNNPQSQAPVRMMLCGAVQD